MVCSCNYAHYCSTFVPRDDYVPVFLFLQFAFCFVMIFPLMSANVKLLDVSVR